VQIGCGIHPDSKRSRFLSDGVKLPEHEATDHLHLVPRLMPRVVPPLHLLESW